MNLIVGSPWWLVAFLILALAAAAIEDVARLRVSNLICAAVVAAALVAAILQGFSASLWQNALVASLILAIGTPVFAIGWFGGGDVKLLAAIGLWFDFRAATGLMAAIFIAGGLVALGYISVRRLGSTARPKRLRHGRVPYGLAIVGGALFAFATQLDHRTANPSVDHISTESAKKL